MEILLQEGTKQSIKVYEGNEKNPNTGMYQALEGNMHQQLTFLSKQLDQERDGAKRMTGNETIAQDNREDGWDNRDDLHKLHDSQYGDDTSDKDGNFILQQVNK